MPTREEKKRIVIDHYLANNASTVGNLQVGLSIVATNAKKSWMVRGRT